MAPSFPLWAISEPKTSLKARVSDFMQDYYSVLQRSRKIAKLPFVKCRREFPSSLLDGRQDQKSRALAQLLFEKCRHESHKSKDCLIWRLLIRLRRAANSLKLPKHLISYFLKTSQGELSQSSVQLSSSLVQVSAFMIPV